MADNSTKGPTDPLITKVYDHGRKAFDLLSSAVTLDERKANLPEALKLYRMGLVEIERCLAIDLSYGKGEKYDRARAHQSKLCKNHNEAKDRVSKLESIVSLQQREMEIQVDPSNIPRSVPRGTSAAVPKTRKASLPSTLQNSGTNRCSSGASHPARPRALPASVPKMNAAARARIATKSPGAQAPRLNTQKSRDEVMSKISALRGVDTKLANMICDQILETNPSVRWSDIAGQGTAKEALREMVILPALRPEFFTGLRAPARGLLLFGPPGNGKTMLAKAVATEAKARFFNISASSLTSKWFGEAEKLVRTLFAVANHIQPSIIFIDEVESLLSKRRDSEHDAMKRLKTEFLVQLDGVSSDPNSRVVLMGATNLPQDLDDAALRRFTKRVYVDMPDVETRMQLLESLLAKDDTESRKGAGSSAAKISQAELRMLANATEGYSASDLTNLAQDAALEPIRECSNDRIRQMNREELRPISFNDFQQAMKRIRSSVPKESLARYEAWNKEFGVVK